MREPLDLGARLSQIQWEILPLLEDGLTSKEIAGTLHRSARTIDNNIGCIFDIFGVRTRGAAATAARKAGLISDDDGYDPEGFASLQIGTAFWEAVKSGEMWRFLSYLTEDHRWINDPAQNPLVSGLQGAEEVMGGYWTAFPDIEFDPTCVGKGPHRIMCPWDAKATHQGPFKGIAPTGRIIEISGFTDLTVLGDKLSVSRVIWDLRGTIRQMLSSSPPRF